MNLNSTERKTGMSIFVVHNHNIFYVYVYPQGDPQALKKSIYLG